MNETFCVGIFEKDYWISGLGDFVAWLNEEQRKCVPKGPCGQSFLVTSGLIGLMAKYPTFEAAYEAWRREAENYGNKTK
ncbi:hypothetical protein PACILC2_22360 [Paenibacillus cisolokensis]|uniref:Uncharacterized protein n=1 Tax=Paenibacillus cisolokensis TaxID=1658519 RepID=A0ABQ4N622_9BACL|nr:hypothetical protein PACILC2_22360 [Paenibacillus cisolokensis]